MLRCISKEFCIFYVYRALIGTKINAVENSLGIDYSNPVNILHVGRSYGPCIACAVHILDLTGKSAPGILRII